MLFTIILLASGLGAPPSRLAADGFGDACRCVVPVTLHAYEARIRLDGKVSTTRVEASDAGHAKRLVQAQYGDRVTVLSVKRLNDRRQDPGSPR